MNRLKSFAAPNSTFFSLFVIAVVCLIAYSNTFHVPFQFDDPGNIDGKPFVRDIGMFFDPARFSPDSVFIMRPVAYFTFALNYRAHGTEVVGYHVVNLVIHILNGFLVYVLVLLTFRTPYFSNQQSAVSDNPSLSPLNLRGDEGGLLPSRFIALFTALLFASHPVQTQAVTYIVQRAASLATLFYLLSLVMYIKGRLASRQAGKLTGYVLSLLSAILAMKTKEMAFTLPLVIALYEFLFFMGHAKKRALYLLPLLLTMLIIPVSLISIGGPAGEIIGDVSDAARANTDISRWDYFFTEFRVVVTYIRLLFFPVNQNLDYDYPVYHSFFEPNVFLSFLFLFSIFCVAAYLLYASRRQKPAATPYPLLPTPYTLPLSPYSRLVAFGIFWFFVTLSVESGIIPILDVIFEHRLYLPSVGFFIAVVATVFLLAEHSRSLPGKTVIALFGIFVVVFSGLTYMRNNVWRSEVTLWEDVARKSPMNARAYNGLGLAYQKEGGLDSALENFQQAVALDPYFAVAHNSLGTIFFRKNLLGRSVEEFSIAIAIEPGNVVFYNNRGLAYAAAGEINRAVADYLAAIRLDPEYSGAYHNLGSAFHAKGLYDRAIAEYTRAIAVEADNAVYYSNRGLAYAARGDFEKAVADYTKTIALDPDFADAFTGRGTAFGQMGRFDEAVADFDRALFLDPLNASAYFNRGVTHEKMGRTGTAISDFQRACEMGDARGCGGVEYIRKNYPVGR